MPRIVVVALMCAAAVAAGLVLQHEIYESIVTGIVSGLLASVAFLFVIFDLKPRVRISSVAVLGYTADATRKLSIKVVNLSRADLIQPIATLHASRRVARGNGIRVVTEKIELVNSSPLCIHRRKSADHELRNVYVFNARILPKHDPIIWRSDYLMFRFVGAHPISGVTRIFEQRFIIGSEKFVEGHFKFGENFDVEVATTA